MFDVRLTHGAKQTRFINIKFEHGRLGFVRQLAYVGASFCLGQNLLNVRQFFRPFDVGRTVCASLPKIVSRLL